MDPFQTEAAGAGPPPTPESLACAGRRALAELDEVLRERPQREGQAFSETTRALAEFRDAMIARRRGQAPDAADRRRLDHVNAVISVVLAGHFPLGPVPWQEIEAARGWLAEVVADSG